MNYKLVPVEEDEHVNQWYSVCNIRRPLHSQRSECNCFSLFANVWEKEHKGIYDVMQLIRLGICLRIV